MRPLDWMRKDTEPTADELAAFEGLSQALRDKAANDSEPLDEEVHALLAWRPQPAQSGVWPIVGLLVPVVLVLIVLGGLWLQSPSAPEVPYRSTGIAAWSARSDGPVTTVTQDLGTRRWEVDPVAPSGTFRVVAGDVTATVLGTVFIVENRPPEVVVRVEEGRVQVDHPWGRTVLSAGESWSRLDALPDDRVSIAAERSVVDAEPVETEPEPIALPSTPDAPEPSKTRAFADALERFASGERTPALAEDLAQLAGTLDAPLGDEAESMSLQVGARVWPAEQARAALDAWLKSHPMAPTRWAVLEAKADLERTRLERCDLAMPSYRALTQRPDRSGRARTHAWLGLCGAALGESATARASLQEALDLGVSGMLREEVELALAALN